MSARSITCDAPGCVRGLVHRPLPGGWADPCRVCEGLGAVSLSRICALVDEHESTMRRVLKPNCKMRPKTAARILDKLLEVVR